MLKASLADPTADAVCETLLVAHEVGGTDLDRRLEALIDDRIQDTQGRKDARAQAGRGALRPAVRAHRPRRHGPGRACRSAPAGRPTRRRLGQLLVVVAIALVVACWVWAGRIMRSPRSSGCSMPRLLAGVAAVPARRSGATPRARPSCGGSAANRSSTGCGPTDPAGLRPSGTARRAALGRLVPRGHRPARPPASASGWPALLGVNEELAVRLRAHPRATSTSPRSGSASWAGAAAGLRPWARSSAAATAAARSAIALLFVLGGPLLAFLVVEQQLAARSDRWKRRIFLELPVLSEQLGHAPRRRLLARRRR